MEGRNKFKGLDLIDRVPEELWTEVPDILQEAGIKTIPKKKKCKQQNSCEKKRSERQSREGKIYPFDAEFQRIA